MPSLKPITPKPTFNPSRVKSSIPKPSKQSEHMRQMIAAKKERDEQSAAYIEELKTTEVKRTVQIEEEHRVTKEVLDRLRNNPNSELHQLGQEVGMLSRKINPILKRVEQATENIKWAGHHKTLSNAPGGIGVLAKMGGRLVSFYADDLAELLF